MKTPHVEELSQMYFTKADAAHYTGLCIRTIDEARDAGHLPSYKVGRRVLIRRDHLEKFVERYRVTVDAGVDYETNSE